MREREEMMGAWWWYLLLMCVFLINFGSVAAPPIPELIEEEKELDMKEIDVSFMPYVEGLVGGWCLG